MLLFTLAVKRRKHTWLASRCRNMHAWDLLSTRAQDVVADLPFCSPRDEIGHSNGGMRYQDQGYHQARIQADLATSWEDSTRGNIWIYVLCETIKCYGPGYVIGLLLRM